VPNVVTLWAHYRPECFYLCLESLRRCRGIEKHPIYIPVNGDSDREIPEIAHKLLKGLDYEIVIRPPGWFCERANGEALKEGLRRSDDYTVILSEDEEVSADTLELFDYVNTHFKNEKLMSVSTSGILLPRPYKPGDEQLLVISGRLQNRTIAVFKEPFEKYAEKYFCEEFYQSEIVEPHTGKRFAEVSWMLRMFPGMEKTLIGSIWGVDGLLQRVITKHELQTLTTVIPRSHEIGFCGVHVNTDPYVRANLLGDLPLEERVDKMREIIKTGEIKQMFGFWSYHYLPLEPDHKWDTLVKMDVVIVSEEVMRSANASAY